MLRSGQDKAEKSSPSSNIECKVNQTEETITYTSGPLVSVLLYSASVETQDVCLLSVLLCSARLTGERDVGRRRAAG